MMVTGRPFHEIQARPSPADRPTVSASHVPNCQRLDHGRRARPVLADKERDGRGESQVQRTNARQVERIFVRLDQPRLHAGGEAVGNRFGAKHYPRRCSGQVRYLVPIAQIQPAP